jgi:flagellar capping protein FliD
MTDSTTGALVNLQDSLTSNINTLTKSVDAADARLAIRRTRYQNQFLAMEKSIQSSNSLSNYLTGQIKGFENAAKGSG